MSRKNGADKEDHVAVDIPAEPTASARRIIAWNSGSVDDDLVHRALGDAGRWAYGTIFVELWVLNEDSTSLYRPEGGWWIDPAVHTTNVHSDKYCRLVDPSHPEYVPANPRVAGVGLAGVLWAETQGETAPSRRRSTFHARRASQFTSNMNLADGMARQPPPHQQQQHPGAANYRKVVWREVRPIAQDPDRPYDRRLEVLANCGLGWAAAVPFYIRDQQGIVVYCAREGVNQQKLHSPTNEHYLVSATDLVGSAWALRGPRQAAVRERNQELDAALRRARFKIVALVRLGISLGRVAENHGNNNDPSSMEWAETDQDVSSCSNAIHKVKTKAHTVQKKARGAQIMPPPPLTVDQSIVSFVGSFLTLLVLTRLNELLVDTYGPSKQVVLGPVGALMMLQYGLTAAPASQPLNIMAGQTLSMSIGIAISYLDDYLDLWLRQTLATSLAIGAAVKLGVSHPPAAAAALTFSAGSFGWANMGILLVANAIAIVMATFLNNFNDKRQYPTYWGFGYILNLIRGRDAKFQKTA